MGHYLNTVKRIDITPINPDGSEKTSPETFVIDKLAKTANFEPIIREGEKIEQTGGGELKSEIKRKDQIYIFVEINLFIMITNIFTKA